MHHHCSRPYHPKAHLLLLLLQPAAYMPAASLLTLVRLPLLLELVFLALPDPRPLIRSHSAFARCWDDTPSLHAKWLLTVPPATLRRLLCRVDDKDKPLWKTYTRKDKTYSERVSVYWDASDAGANEFCYRIRYLSDPAPGTQQACFFLKGGLSVAEQSV